jgi:hypothetical protein
VSLEVGFLPASPYSLSETFRVLYVALSLIYAIEFRDVRWEKRFPSVCKYGAATWLYKVVSLLELNQDNIILASCT